MRRKGGEGEDVDSTGPGPCGWVCNLFLFLRFLAAAAAADDDDDVAADDDDDDDDDDGDFQNSFLFCIECGQVAT